MGFLGGASHQAHERTKREAQARNQGEVYLRDEPALCKPAGSMYTRIMKAVARHWRLAVLIVLALGYVVFLTAMQEQGMNDARPLPTHTPIIVYGE